MCHANATFQHLYDAAQQVQSSNDSVRPLVLVRNMENIDRHLSVEHTALPLSPSLVASGVHARVCSYFPSKTVPLKIIFGTEASEGRYSKSDADGGSITSSGSEHGEASAIEFGTALPSPSLSIPVIYKVVFCRFAPYSV